MKRKIFYSKKQAMTIRWCFWHRWLFFMATLPLCCTASLVYAKAYRYEDDKGIVYYSNQPSRSKLGFRQGRKLPLLPQQLPVSNPLYDNMIDVAAAWCQLPPALLKAVMAVESRFNPRAISPAGAMGLMQLMPATAQSLQIKDPYDPWSSIWGGARYLQKLQRRFQGNLRFVLAAYNAGPTVVERLQAIPPYEETQNYVQKVLELYQYYQYQGSKLSP